MKAFTLLSTQLLRKPRSRGIFSSRARNKPRAKMSDYGSDEDEDLKRAIALSLAPFEQSSPQKPIDLTSDNDDTEQIKKISIEPAKILQKVDNLSKMSKETEAAGPDKMGIPLTGSGGVRFGNLSIDRKKMEEERLARIRKRKASASPPPNSRDESHDSKASNTRVKLNPTGETVRGSNVMSYRQQQAAQQANGIQYPKGVVKKTWAYGYPREKDIKIEEVLQKQDLDLAVMSSWQWDDDWIASKLNTSRTKLICVVQTEDEEQRTLMRTTCPSTVRYIFPSMAGQINCMHAKFFLLSHPTHLRICIPSANLVPYDWGESGGSMENIVFLIDLPRLPDGQMNAPNDVTSFGKELFFFLEAMGMDQNTLKSLLKFDYSETKDLAFVHSIGGAHTGNDLKRTGFCGLGTAIRKLGLSTDDLELDWVASSIGSLTDEFLTTLFLAAKGDDGMTAYNWRNDTKSRTKNYSKSAKEQEIIEQMRASLRVYFPTRKTVAESRGGIGGGGTICLQSNHWFGKHFPRSIFRDCHSKRHGMLMHSKIIFARLGKPSFPTRFAAWAYVGSANLSPSAWGILVKDSKTKLPKLNCRNWECGVIVPVPSPQKHQTEKGALEMEIFDGVVPVPMEFPGVEYGGKRPWINRDG